MHSEQSFAAHVDSLGADEELRDLLSVITSASVDIARLVRGQDARQAETTNVYGERQMRIDIACHEILCTALRTHPSVSCIASEEADDVEQCQSDGVYAVAFDPLDGSALIGTNFAVGTIVGVYKAMSFDGVKPREQVASLLIHFGPQTVLTYTLGGGSGVHSCSLHDDFVLVKESLSIDSVAGSFSPGNIHAATESASYKGLLDKWIASGMILRYGGCTASDVHHLLHSGSGIFVHPRNSTFPEGKLRLLFEAGPLALLVEEAGGASSNGERSILDLPVTAHDQRTPLFLGSRDAVSDAVSVGL